jgi:predicted peptidase
MSGKGETVSQESRLYTGRTGTGGDAHSIHYLFHLPDKFDHDTARRWPLILFLHGRGECGEDLAALKRHGIPKIVEKQPDFPFVTVCPQCPAGAPEWDPYLPLLAALPDDVVAEYPIDPRRVYLTGLSMGGRGAWQFAVYESILAILRSNHIGNNHRGV